MAQRQRQRLGLGVDIIIDELLFCISVVDEFEFCASVDDETNENCAVRASARTNIASPVRVFLICFLLGKIAVLTESDRSGDGNEWMQQSLRDVKKWLRVNSQQDDAN